MLGDDFELEFEDGTVWLEADSGEEIWKLFSESAPPVTALVRELDDGKREEFHRAFVELYDSYQAKDGGRNRCARAAAGDAVSPVRDIEGR